jgi:malate synthase
LAFLDGLWNFIKARDCASIMGSHISEKATKDIKEEENDKDPHRGDIQVKLEESNSIYLNEKIIQERKLKIFLTS